jgi:hypothetical protein
MPREGLTLRLETKAIGTDPRRTARPFHDAPPAIPALDAAHRASDGRRPQLVLRDRRKDFQTLGLGRGPTAPPAQRPPQETASPVNPHS